MKGVVVCPEPLAALAGAHVFRLGGSAIDAAIATAFAQTVVSPAMTTIAGNGIMNVFHAPTGRHQLVDFMGYAGARATAEMYERAPAIGDRVVQPDLARTLRILADDGADAFYTGVIGKRLARDLESHGAPVTARDLAECRCVVGDPLHGVYRGLTVSTDPAPHI